MSPDIGILICSSGMGLSPMDLFNDIFTDRRDLENFLGENDCKDSDNISLRSVFKVVLYWVVGMQPFEWTILMFHPDWSI